jgi:hypothetical protein
MPNNYLFIYACSISTYTSSIRDRRPPPNDVREDNQYSHQNQLGHSHLLEGSANHPRSRSNHLAGYIYISSEAKKKESERELRIDIYVRTTAAGFGEGSGGERVVRDERE